MFFGFAAKQDVEDTSVCRRGNHVMRFPGTNWLPSCLCVFLPTKAEVAKHFGTNVDAEDTKMVAARKEFDEKKKALADAFGRKARALAEVEDLRGERSQRFFLAVEPLPWP